ncbi:coiled-coil domain-containing protein 129 [Nothoprocta perdicaria]|uniref:coiled-coil domain-containing protein 129 n=1 Tax=Nothoprocta perdicaria TaxID=30464 RepID=UPI000E1BC298|nr:coiled-coil domain-containing protein 129 [Nothoprocta perdicaria]
MVQMTVQSYRRSLQEFSESPVMSRCSSLNSSHSLISVPQSVSEWLAIGEKDPVEILLDLGFGTEEPDVCTKIPPRFLHGASVAKGINIRVFLEAQKQRMDIESPNLYGRFRQLQVLDRVTSAFSLLLTDVNTHQSKAQGASKGDTGHLDTEQGKPVVTRAKKRISQLLKRASRQTLLKQSSLASGEAKLSGWKGQPYSCGDAAESGTVQVGFSEDVTMGCLTPEQNSRGKDALTIPQCPQTPSEGTWSSSHLLPEQSHLSSACEVPAKDRPRKELSLLVAPTLKKMASQSYKLPDSFELEEIQSLEEETPCRYAPDSISEVMVTRTNSCQSDSSGFMEELPEPSVLQNASLSAKINLSSDTHNHKMTLSYSTALPMSNQDFQEKTEDCIAKAFITDCRKFLTVSRPMRTCSDQGEETCPLLTAEDCQHQTCGTGPLNFVQKMLCDVVNREEKNGTEQPKKEEYIRPHTPCFPPDNQDEGDAVSSKFDYQLYCSPGHKNMNVAFTEQSDTNPETASESKVKTEEESERYLTDKDFGATRHENVQGHPTELVEGEWWRMEVVGENGPLLSGSEVTNGQRFCTRDGDSRNMSSSFERGLPETLWQGPSVPRESSAVSSSSPQRPQIPLSCPTEGPRLSSSEDKQTCSIGEVPCINKSAKQNSVQSTETNAGPLKSVTVQMSSRLDFTSKMKYTGQNAPCCESAARDHAVDFSEVSAHRCEGGLKQTTEASSQTNIPARKTRQVHLPPPPCHHLVKSVSLDTVFCGKYGRCYKGEASGAQGTQGYHCRGCCHHCCCCCFCLRNLPPAISPQCPVGCCSNHAATELQLWKTLVFLQETAARSSSPCTIHEIEMMKSSCQQFREKLNEIEQYLTEQQVLLSGALSDEEREERRHLQLLRQAVRQEVAELEFRLNDRACQLREGILMQLDQLLVEQSHLFSELGLSDWKEERNAQNKQALPDAVDTVHPRSGFSEMVLQRVPSRSTTAGSLPTLQPGTPIMQFPTRTTLEPNSAESDPQELSTTKKEINGPLKPKMDFKAFVHNLKKSFRNSLGNGSAEGKD